MGSSLPTKEANLFKLIVKAYETKQYKKGLKSADTILKKFPEHGETLSMKGLILSCLEKKAEAYEYVRRGLKYDLKSHVCWHVYGILYRGDRDYKEAIKCYRNALRIDPENLQILRDLSLLQVQMRDRSGFVETRRQLLTLKPNNRTNWISFAISQHLSQNYEMAVQILGAYEKTLEEDYPPKSERFEHSEFLLYKISILEEAGHFKEALEQLEKNEKDIIDRVSVLEKKASLLFQLGRKEEARERLLSLLDLNPDNYNYLGGYFLCLGILPEGERVGERAGEGKTPLMLLQGSNIRDFSMFGRKEENAGEMKRVLDELRGRESFKYSSAVKRIPLDFLSGEELEEAVDLYMRPFLKKGVPSLFSDLEPLYNDPEKAQAIESVSLSFASSLLNEGRFPPSTRDGSKEKRGVDGERDKGDDDSGKTEAEGEKEDLPEPPSTLAWLHFFLAQHYEKRGDTSLALSSIDKAISHTPTVADFCLVKSRILQRAGNFVEASIICSEARCMDLSDRFLNSESVEAMLKADQLEQAEKTALLFVKDATSHSSLIEMQAMWYVLGAAESYFRQGNWAKSLKFFLYAHKFYTDALEDQFDFHSYCLKKMTLHSYVQMLKFEDSLLSTPPPSLSSAHGSETEVRSFVRGVQGAVRCYLRLLDEERAREEEIENEGKEGEEGGNEGDSSRSQAEKKRERQKQRKAEAKAKKESEAQTRSNASTPSASTATPSSGKSNKNSSKTPVDDDPDGKKLIQIADKLSECTKHLSLLLAQDDKNLLTNTLAFEVFWRRGKWLLVLKTVKRLLFFHPTHPETHKCLFTFFHAVRQKIQNKEPFCAVVPSKESKDAKFPEPGSSENDELVRRVIELELPSFGAIHSCADLPSLNLENLKENPGSLSHCLSVAEVHLKIEPSQKEKCVQIFDCAVNPTAPSGSCLREGVYTWNLSDCAKVYTFLADKLRDQAAAERWKSRCAEYFPLSTYFGGTSSATFKNGKVRSSAPSLDESAASDTSKQAESEINSAFLNGLSLT